jgi:Ca-activated chloride channel family protein
VNLSELTMANGVDLLRLLEPAVRPGGGLSSPAMPRQPIESRSFDSLKLESRTKYNLGNVKYQQALQAMSNPQDAIPHVQSAMTYYRDSLDVDGQQPEARYNLELAHRLLRQLQQQQQDQSQNPDDPKQASQDQRQDAQDDQKPEQNQTEARQKESSQDSQNPQTGPSDQDQAKSPTDPEPNESQPLPQQAQELTPEEAERLLETIRERAQEADRAREQRRRARWRGTRVDKDW